MKLEADCKLISTIQGWNPMQHLRINSGIEMTRPTLWEGAGSENYCYNTNVGVYTPKTDWRPLESAELFKLIGITDGEDFPTTIQLLQIPDTLLTRGRECINEHIKNGTAEKPLDFFLNVSEKLVPEFIAELNEWVFENICTHSGWCDIGTVFRFPNQVFKGWATQASSTGWGGLHIDLWGPSPRRQMQSGYHGSRLILNLGEEDRQFVFMNLRVATMVQEHSEIFEPPHIAPLKELLLDRGLRLVGDAFMEMYPDYPVISVTLKPGWGYFAPTTSVLHDGYLGEMKLITPDVTLRTGHPKAEMRKGQEPWIAPTYLSAWRQACLQQIERLL